RQLEAEGGRFGVDAVAAANHGCELIFPGLGGDGFAEGADVFEEQASRLHHLDGEGGIHNVAAGQAKVEPAAGGRADVFGDVGREGDDVVVEDAFQFLAAFQAEGGAGLHLVEIL